MLDDLEDEKKRKPGAEELQQKKKKQKIGKNSLKKVKQEDNTKDEVLTEMEEQCRQHILESQCRQEMEEQPNVTADLIMITLQDLIEECGDVIADSGECVTHGNLKLRKYKLEVVRNDIYVYIN